MKESMDVYLRGCLEWNQMFWRASTWFGLLILTSCRCEPLPAFVDASAYRNELALTRSFGQPNETMQVSCTEIQSGHVPEVRPLHIDCSVTSKLTVQVWRRRCAFGPIRSVVAVVDPQRRVVLDVFTSAQGR